MKTLDIYNDEKISRLLQVQRLHAIDFNSQIDWGQSIDLNRPLLPLDEKALLFPDASSEERLVISQFMGLIVASTISELERVALSLKKTSWDDVLKRYPVNPEIRELGESFYEDETKHSQAFGRYINLFAERLGVEVEDLKSLLPSSESLIKHVYRVDSLMGGMAIWWLIAAVEEESISIFNHMRDFRSDLDPLYYALHRAHFEEEVRHKSYASLMIQINQEFSHSVTGHFLKHIDFLLAELMNRIWSFQQLSKIKQASHLREQHHFFKVLDGLHSRLNEKNSLQTLKVLFNEARYTKGMFNISHHKSIQLLRSACTA
jgi:predicted metal-dependent hydrolase